MNSMTHGKGMGILGSRFRRKGTQTSDPAKSVSQPPIPPGWAFLSGTSDQISKGMGSQYRDGYERNPYVYQCVHLRAGSVSSVPPLAHDRAGNELLDPEHPLLRLLRRPNSRQSWAQFIGQVETYLAINGNVYIYPIVTTFEGVAELWAFDADSVVPMRSNNKFAPVTGWQLNTGTSTIRLEPDQLIHIKLNASSDDLLGVSPMYVARMYVEQQNIAGVWNKSTLQNGARPSMVIKAPEMTKSQRRDLRQEVRDSTQGAANSSNVMLIDDRMEVTPLGFTAVEMDYVQGVTMAARAICVAYSVPSELVGDVANKTYANLSEARSQYAKSCILPELQLIYGELEHYLLPRFPDVGDITFDVAQVQDLAGDQTAMYTAMTTVDFLTTNEKRAIFGFDDVGIDGDVILTNMSRIPLNEAASLIETPPMEQGPEGDAPPL